MGEFAIWQRVILMGGPVVGWASSLHYDTAVLMGKSAVVSLPLLC